MSDTQYNDIIRQPEAARVIDKANMPNLFAMADLHHMIGAGEPLEDIVRYRDIVRHVHMDDPLSYPERKYACLNNGYDYAPFFEQLRDYQGMLTVEAEIPGDARGRGASGAGANLSALTSKKNLTVWPDSFRPLEKLAYAIFSNERSTVCDLRYGSPTSPQGFIDSSKSS